MEYGAKTTIFEYKIWLWCCAKLHAFSVKLYRIHIWKTSFVGFDYDCIYDCIYMIAFGIASKEPKNAFAFSSIQKRRVCGIDDIAVFLVRNAKSLNSWIVQTSLQESGPLKSSRFNLPFCLNCLTLFWGSLKWLIGNASQNMRRRCVFGKEKL